MRRASVSIASNIAEANGRSTRGEYGLFLGHARGSNCELQTQLSIARNLRFCGGNADELAEKLSAEVSRMLNALMKKLKGWLGLLVPFFPRSLVPCTNRF
jgi:four helix bundle protein